MILFIIPFMSLVAYISSKDKAFKSLVTGFVAGVIFLFLVGDKLTSRELFVLGTIIALYSTDLIKLLKLLPNLYLEEKVNVSGVK